MTLTAASFANGAAVYAEAFIAGWTPAAPVTVATWADQHRKMLSVSSAEPGNWETGRTPYLREIMDCLSAESPVRDISFMKSSQVGGTEALINWICYVIGHHPCPMMVVLPTIDTAKAWSKQRLQPTIEEMPVLRDRVGPQRSRDPDDTVLMKTFPGGFLRIAGANSSASLRSMPVKYLAMDEIDEYEDDLNKQGSPVELAQRRTTTFVRRKRLRVSTPTVKDASHIEKAFDEGDQRRYFVPCPHCDHAQVLEIDQLTDDGQYLCKACGVLIGEHHKTEMLARGTWMPAHPERTDRSYHISALYSPIGLGDTWMEIARARERSRTDADFEVIFVNTILGLPYAGAGQRVESSELAGRAEKWSMKTIPRGGLVLTVGVDVQQNRFAVLIMAWGRGEQCWFVDWVEIPADPTREGDWVELEKVVFAPIVNSCGVKLRAHTIAVDSGNFTHDVYNWVRKHQHRGVFAIKGSSQANRPAISRPTPQDVRARGKVHKHGVQLWTIGVHTLKTTLFGRLVGDTDLDVHERRQHFPADLPRYVYEQLVAEYFDLRRKRWVKKPGARNEAWDCFIYAYAAACHPYVRVHVKREADWAALEVKVEPANSDLFAEPAESVAPVVVAAAPAGELDEEVAIADGEPVASRGTSHRAPRRGAAAPRRGGWMGGTR